VLLLADAFRMDLLYIAWTSRSAWTSSPRVAAMLPHRRRRWRAPSRRRPPPLPPRIAGLVEKGERDEEGREEEKRERRLM
jgi:hypothetical protein